MRYFQKAFRRADIDNEYSKGFSPHQIMSFAAPLGVGLTSDAEYLDISLLSSDSPEIMINRINAVLTEGMRIVDFKLLPEPELNTKVITAMSLVSRADYLVSLKDGYTISDQLDSQKKFEEAFLNFIDKQEIVVGKKTKTSEKEVDIKPMIHLIAFGEEEYQNKETTAEVYQNGIKIYMQIDTGSSANLKPELVMEAFYEELEIPFNKFAWQVHRLEVYAKDPASDTIAPLNQVQ
jgi:radical SAM-linked protein